MKDPINSLQRKLFVLILLVLPLNTLSAGVWSEWFTTKKTTKEITDPSPGFFACHPKLLGAGIISGAAAALSAAGYYGATYIKNNVYSSIDPEHVAGTLALLGVGAGLLYWLSEPLKDKDAESQPECLRRVDEVCQPSEIVEMILQAESQPECLRRVDEVCQPSEVVEKILQGNSREVWLHSDLQMQQLISEYPVREDLYSHLIDQMTLLNDRPLYIIASDTFGSNEKWRHYTVAAVRGLAKKPHGTCTITLGSSEAFTTFNLLELYLTNPFKNPDLKAILLNDSNKEHLPFVMAGMQLVRFLKKAFPRATIKVTASTAL